MSQFIVPSTVRGIVAVFLLLAPACNRADEPEEFNRKHADDGRRYKEALVKAIKVSDRIVVTEHSDRSDYPTSEQMQKELPQVEYGRVELDGPARAKFLQNAEAMDGTTKTDFNKCFFFPHHTVRFYSGSKLKSTMKICFKCSDIVWDGARLVPPIGLWTAITPLIKDAGFHTERDEEVWVARLEERRKAGLKK
jgi:hypothetical protein